MQMVLFRVQDGLIPAGYREIHEEPLGQSIATEKAVTSDNSHENFFS